LKTLVAMPFVLDGKTGTVEIAARGVRQRSPSPSIQSASSRSSDTSAAATEM
jgi:hypothetical protein